MIASVCRPGALDSCRPIWNVVEASPALDLITAAGILFFCWVIIAALTVGGTLILEKVKAKETR